MNRIAILTAIGISLIAASVTFGQTNANPTVGQLPTPPGLALTVIQTALPQASVFAPLSSLISVVQSNGESHTGIAANLHGKYGASLSQQLNILGFNHTNNWLHIGIETDTAFLQTGDPVSIGVGISGAWDKAPKFLKILLFNADDIEWHFGVGETWDTWTHLTQHPDWKSTQGNFSIGRKI